jgi:SAM-dependent methyltransferase
VTSAGVARSGTTHERERTTIRTGIGALVAACRLAANWAFRSYRPNSRLAGAPGIAHPPAGRTGTIADADLARGYPWPSTRRRVAGILATTVDRATVLDLRPGPWAFPGFPSLGDRVVLVSADPLARAHGLSQAPNSSETPVCGERLYGEQILEQFHTDHFDRVYARDWVDRCRDPQQVIRQILRVVKPGGFLLAEHRLCVAGQDVDDGLRRWGLSKESAARFDIRFREDEIPTSCEFGAACQIECERVNPGEYWLVMKIRKNR